MKISVYLLLASLLLTYGCASGAKPVEKDYLAPGTYLAALRVVSWEDTVCMAKAYVVTIETQASEATGMLTKVVPLMQTKEMKEAAHDSWTWTPFVFQSRPALRAELKTGQWVLCVRSENPIERHLLGKQEWLYRQIVSLASLTEGLVEVSYYDTYHHEQRNTKVHWGNIRLVENPIPEDSFEFR